METQKGANSFNMHLTKISINDEDQPIGRQATLRLSTQQDQATLLKASRRLMEIHIDGRLMARWDFSILEQHSSYQNIRIFESFNGGKHINSGKHIHMNLPLPLTSNAGPEKNADRLKAIRVYFNKAQDFHTAINWLSKQAQLIHLDGRSATSDAFHTSASDARQKARRPDVQPTMAPAQLSASQDREQTSSRPPRGIGQQSIPAHVEQPQSRPQSRTGQPPSSRYPRRPVGQRQSRGQPQPMSRSRRGQRRESDLHRNMFAPQETDRSATAQPSESDYGLAATRAGRLQMPRVVKTPSRTPSATHNYYRFLPPHRLSDEDGPDVAPYAVANAPSGQHSIYSSREYSRGGPSLQPSQQSHVPGASYLATGPPVHRAPSRLSQSNSPAMMPTQSTLAADSTGFDLPDPSANDSDDALPRRRVMSMAPPGAMISGASPDHLNSDWRSTTSSQKRCVPAISQTDLRPRPDSPEIPEIPEIPPANLFAATGMTRQRRLNQDVAADSDSLVPRPPSAASQRQPLTELNGVNMNDTRARQGHPEEGGPKNLQGHAIHQKRPMSAQAGRKLNEKRRKANQGAPLKRADRRAGGTNDINNDSSNAANETHKEAASPDMVVQSLSQKPTAYFETVSKGVEMADHAVQTDAVARIQVDTLHLSAAMELYRRLLQEPKQWKDMDHRDERLLCLGLQFMRGLRCIFRSA